VDLGVNRLFGVDSRFKNLIQKQLETLPSGHGTYNNLAMLFKGQQQY